MVDYELQNRVVLVTGANNPQGIGATTVLHPALPKQVGSTKS